MSKSRQKVTDLTYPVLALRDVVVYPHMVIPLFVGRDSSIKAVEAASKAKESVFLVSQKDPAVDDPKRSDLYSVGCVANILQLLKLPDGTIKVLVEGASRAKLVRMNKRSGFLKASVQPCKVAGAEKITPEIEILMRTVKSQFEEYIKLNKRIPQEILTPLDTISSPSRLADTVAAHLPVVLEKRQQLLEKLQTKQRLEAIVELIEAELDYMQIEKKVKGRVKRQMEKSQREYYLNEQIKAIQSELGEMGESPNEVEALEKKIDSSGMTKEAKEKCLAEIGKLKMMPPMSAEATVCRNYLDTILSVPWKKMSRLRGSLNQAQELLEDEHYGLEKVKERILEYLAVQKRVKKLKGPILCLVGPPGVGKTSLGHSIAKATGRKFVRMSLGGVRDEAEIRGHRRTYIGAMPGKIIQKVSKAGVKNPFFLLDEIDKMAMDFRGDPASALLEVLDPEQNGTFNDHYLEVDYDLSDIMFVATANTLDIPAPLLDRMEVIRISGYTEDEKINIAKRHLVEKQITLNGLEKSELTITAGGIKNIIRYYTREAGVRSLEREIAKICRKVVKEILTSKKVKKITVNEASLEKYLGVKKYTYGLAEDFNSVGQVTGLAWTEVGGELLRIEAAVVPGKGKTQYTGCLGNVMQESIHAAMTVVRGRSTLFNVEEGYFEKNNIHIHVPEGATPKDGPSAGIGMCTALVSMITGLSVRADVAMTGEITLRGEVLPIGGLKEKLLAAHRGNIKTVIIPEENLKDLQEIPANIKRDLDIKPVKWIDDVLSVALVGYIEFLSNAKPATKATKYRKAAAAKKGRARTSKRAH